MVIASKLLVTVTACYMTSYWLQMQQLVVAAATAMKQMADKLIIQQIVVVVATASCKYNSRVASGCRYSWLSAANTRAG